MTPRTTLKSLRERCFTAPPKELAWGPVGFELFTPEPGHRTWFQAYLHTSGPDALPVRHRHRVFSVTDAEVFERLAAGLADVTHTAVEDYTGRPYRHGEVEDATYWLTANPADNLGETNPYLVVHQDGDWHVLSPPTPAAARNATVVARELLRWHLLAEGALVVHSSAAVTGTGAFVFCGDAGSGKTTLALAAAQAGGRFISGDRTALLPETDLTAVGIALAARVRPGTLTGLNLERRLNGHEPLRTLPGKRLLTQTDLEVLGGIGTAAAGPVTGLVFTRRAEVSVPRLEEIAFESARDLLAPQVLGYDNHWPARWLLDGLDHSGPPPEPGRRAAVHTRLERVRLLRLTWDPHRGNVAAALDLIKEVAHGPARIPQAHEHGDGGRGVRRAADGPG